MKQIIALSACILMLGSPRYESAQNTALAVPPSGVIGVTDAMLSPQYWIAKARMPIVCS